MNLRGVTVIPLMAMIKFLGVNDMIMAADVVTAQFMYRIIKLFPLERSLLIYSSYKY